MYRKVLAIHLCTALFSLAFLAMYGASAVELAHRTWFRLRDEVTETRVALPPNLPGARAAAHELAARYGIDGELAAVLDTPAVLRFRIERPATTFQVRYEPYSGETLVTVRRGSFARMLIALHNTAGMWHNFAPLNAWAGALGLISLGLLLLGATGFYLWWRNPSERWIGAVLLAGGTGLAVTLIAGMRLG
jgi:hypothetical protein